MIRPIRGTGEERGAGPARCRVEQREYACGAGDGPVALVARGALLGGAGGALERAGEDEPVDVGGGDVGLGGAKVVVAAVLGLDHE
jgi:hypothetical protein